MRLIDLNSSTLSIIFAINLIVLAVSIQICVERLDIKVKSKDFIYSFLLVLTSFILVQILAEIGTNRMLIAKRFTKLNVYIFILLLFSLASLETLFIIRIRRDRKKEIGKNSIKESMDNLPDGLCFSKMDGTPLLVNRQMQDLSYKVFGKHLVNDVVCERMIREGNIKHNAKILQEDPLVVECNGKVWLIQIIIHEDFRETLAYDISMEWAVLKEIKKKNQEIDYANYRLRKYQEAALEYTRQKEILRSKINIHDKIGQALIYFRHYLDKKDKSDEDRSKLVQLWKESLLVLDENKEETSNSTAWEKLLSTAKSIGVDIHLIGCLPVYECDKKILVSIVHEALNNAIRHGEAKNVWIKLNEDERKTYCEISNDGKKASANFEEKGGLKNIRERIKIYSGEMNIDAKDKFTLQISWLKGEDYDL